MPKNRNTRRRKLPGQRVIGKSRVGLDPNWYTNNDADFSGKQITVSEGHRWPPPKGEGLVDEGGDFYTSKSYVANQKLSIVRLLSNVNDPGNKVESITPLYPAGAVDQFSPGPLTPKFPPTLEYSNSKMDQLGATAIAQCKPGEPIADLATFLGEIIKDGLPALPLVNIFKERGSPRKGASGEYLNYQFGTRPLVKDVKDLVHAVTHSGQVLAQYERDSGKVVRRSFAFPSEDTTTETNANGFNTIPYGSGPGWTTSMATYGMSAGGAVRLSRKVTRRVRFSGAFTYHLPAGYNSSEKMKEYSSKFNTLTGGELTIESLWKIAPWSWAVDWFSNAGDVISNLDDFKRQGLVMHYGYLMVHTIVQDTYSQTWPTVNNNRPVVSPLIFVTETKQRRKANPFGFGVSWDGLSPFQLSIAAALGLNRGR
jgi:hypothetical protein